MSSSEGPAPGPADDLRGRTIGNYVLSREVGRGGMGTVYLAEHTRLSRKVAVKVLLPERGRDPSIVTRFFNEARAASDIRNAHIVDVIDFGDLEPGRPYLMMEWLEGRSLRDAIAAEAPFPLARVLHITSGICRALVAAHAHGVVHRDLKPDNIFLIDVDGDRDFVKVVDFGIAKLLVRSDSTGPQTAVNAVLGTPEYMSPEQCRGENATLDGRSDVYSLGLIAYEMITGRRPFDATSYVGNIVAQLTREPPPPSQYAPSLPVNVERVVLKALSKDRADRQDSMAEFWNELARAADATQPPKTSTPATGTPVRPHRSTLPFAGQSATTVQRTAPATVASPPASATVINPPPSPLLPRLVLGAGVLALLGVIAFALLRGTPSRPPPAAQPSVATAGAPGSSGTAPAAPSPAPPAAPPGAPTTPAAPVPAAPAPTPPAPDAPRPPVPARPHPVTPPALPRLPSLPDERHALPPTSPTVPVSPRAEESDAALERRLSQESARLAPSGRRYGAAFSGQLASGKGNDHFAELEGGFCYTLVAVASDGVRELHTFLWDPSGKRLGQDASSSNVSCFTACAIESGRYRVHTRVVGGSGRFRGALLRSSQ